MSFRNHRSKDAPRPHHNRSKTMVMQSALRTGARLSAGAMPSSKYIVVSMAPPRTVGATAASPATAVFRGLATQTHRVTTATQWKRPAPSTGAAVPVVSWRQQYQPTDQYSRTKSEGDGQVIRTKSEDAIALIRKLEALRLVNVNVGGGGVPTTSTESGEVSTEEYSAMNRNNRKPKKANHGARPCSRYSRRSKKRKWGNPRR